MEICKNGSRWTKEETDEVTQKEGGGGLDHIGAIRSGHIR
jgi:hypothetical protein